MHYLYIKYQGRFMYKSLDRYKLTLLLQQQLFVFILLVYLTEILFIFMLICIDNISHC